MSSTWIGPEAVAPGCDAEHRETPEQPGDVVDEDVAPAEEDGGAQDCVREPGLAQRALDLCLAAEVREARVERRVRDRDVDDALDAGLGGGPEEARLCSTARAWVEAPWSKRTQYVL